MKKLVLNNENLEGVVYKTKNLVIQKTQQGKRRKTCYIIGNGHSLNVNDNNIVTKHDPGMHKFEPKLSKDGDIYVFYFTFECIGLEFASKEIAGFVNKLRDYEQIFLIGHSKCGLCLYNASHYCKRDIILVTISTPFHGTIIADKNAVQKKLKFSVLKKIHNKIFMDHNVDRDIIPNATFIRNIKEATFIEHINIVSSMENIFNCKSMKDFFLFICGKVMKINGDGIVSVESQKFRCTRTVRIFCTHASSLTKGLEVIEKMF